VQLLRANGCRVLGIDVDPARIKQALDQGAEWGARPDDDHTGWTAAATGGHGADLALVTAASESSAPIQLAAELCRMKGRVAAVGATAMDLDRRTFYEKELELRMSMSYGPGRYDRAYEESGLDYPIEYVRWTENRNLQAFLALAASGGIDPGRLDTQTVDFAAAEATYGDLAAGRRRSLAVIFRYASAGEPARTLALSARAAKRDGAVGVAFVGAGNYAKAVLLPALARVPGVSARHLVTATGASARRSAEKFGFAQCGTDPGSALADPSVDLVFVATQHDSHAALAEAALRAGKAVWLEKPAALDEVQLDSLARAVARDGGLPRRRLQPALLRARARDPRFVRRADRADGALVHGRGRADAGRQLAGRSHGGRGSNRGRGVPHDRSVQLPGRSATRERVRARARPRSARRRLDGARARLRRRLDRHRSPTWRMRAPTCPRSASRSRRTDAPPRATTSARRASLAERSGRASTRTRARRRR
jgi:polar amino acid transport system substrate-binding protein